MEWLRKTLKPIVLRRREIEVVTLYDLNCIYSQCSVSFIYLYIISIQRIMHRSEDDAQQNPLSVKEKRHRKYMFTAAILLNPQFMHIPLSLHFMFSLCF